MDCQYPQRCISPLTQVYAIQRVYNRHKKCDLTKLITSNSTISINSVNPDSLTIVYVIGESHNRYHSSLYGYPLITDPQMKSLYNDSSLIVFNNVISGYTKTYEAYPRLLSTHELGNDRYLHEYPLLPAVMKKAGFTSEYYNNQSLNTGTQIDFSANFLFSKTEIQKQCYSKCNERFAENETNIVHEFPIGRDKRVFTIYHLWGQHVPCKGYVDTIFNLQNYRNVVAYTDNERASVADCDNSTYKVDKILGDIVSQIKDRTAVMVYVSDHGERFYDYDHKYGRQQTASADMVKFVIEVPLYIYVSDKYKALYPERVAKLRAATNKPIYNSDIAHTIIELAGIETDAYNPKLSLLTPGVYRKERPIPEFENRTYESYLPEITKIKPVYSRQSSGK